MLRIKSSLLLTFFLVSILAFFPSITFAEEGEDTTEATCTPTTEFTITEEDYQKALGLENPPQSLPIQSCLTLKYERPLLALLRPPLDISDLALEVNRLDNWKTADETRRNNYCQATTCLQEKLEYNKKAVAYNNTNKGKDGFEALPFECGHDTIEERTFLDNELCVDLVCQEPTVNLSTTYYPSHEDKVAILEARRLSLINENICIARGNPGPECILDRNAKIETCNDCKRQIYEYTVNSSAIPHSSCTEFVRVPSCETAFSCTSGNPSATFRYDSSSDNTENSADRTPFGTEFFNVSDSERGLSTATKGRFSVNVEGGGITGLINTLANLAMRIISLVSLVIFISGAFLLIIANGDEGKIKKGKDALIYSLIGIVIVGLSFVITIFVQSIFF